MARKRKTRRSATISRKTAETDIRCELDLDGSGASAIDTGSAFMDHMLTLFSRHGRFDLRLRCRGDVDVDFHHSAEDAGICMGDALRTAAGDMRGIIRYGTACTPMDESLARVCIDLCGRPNLIYAVELGSETVGGFECRLVREFFKAMMDHGRCTAHIDLIRGSDPHHSLEAVFKAFGRALADAVAIDPHHDDEIPSTKGTLA